MRQKTKSHSSKSVSVVEFPTEKLKSKERRGKDGLLKERTIPCTEYCEAYQQYGT